MKLTHFYDLFFCLVRSTQFCEELVRPVLIHVI